MKCEILTYHLVLFFSVHALGLVYSPENSILHRILPADASGGAADVLCHDNGCIANHSVSNGCQLMAVGGNPPLWLYVSKLLISLIYSEKLHYSEMSVQSLKCDTL